MTPTQTLIFIKEIFNMLSAGMVCIMLMLVLFGALILAYKLYKFGPKYIGIGVE